MAQKRHNHRLFFTNQRVRTRMKRSTFVDESTRRGVFFTCNSSIWSGCCEPRAGTSRRTQTEILSIKRTLGAQKKKRSRRNNWTWRQASGCGKKNWRVSHQLIENSISWLQHPSRRHLVIVCATWRWKVGISAQSTASGSVDLCLVCLSRRCH